MKVSVVFTCGRYKVVKTQHLSSNVADEWTLWYGPTILLTADRRRVMTRFHLAIADLKEMKL